MSILGLECMKTTTNVARPVYDEDIEASRVELDIYSGHYNHYLDVFEQMCSAYENLEIIRKAVSGSQASTEAMAVINFITKDDFGGNITVASVEEQQATVWERIKAFFKKMWDIITGFFKRIWGYVKNLWNRLTGNKKKIEDAVKAEIVKPGDKLADVFKKAKSAGPINPNSKEGASDGTWVWDFKGKIVPQNEFAALGKKFDDMVGGTGNTTGGNFDVDVANFKKKCELVRVQIPTVAESLNKISAAVKLGDSLKKAEESVKNILKSAEAKIGAEAKKAYANKGGKGMADSAKKDVAEFNKALKIGQVENIKKLMALFKSAANEYIRALTNIVASATACSTKINRAIAAINGPTKSANADANRKAFFSQK